MKKYLRNSGIVDACILYLKLERDAEKSNSGQLLLFFKQNDSQIHMEKERREEEQNIMID